ncbi:MAG: hypothetical protein LBP61_05595, partial [Desulfovibrio sp.]|nr:hypothetical protein [Desulfovibrio sp.]
PPIYGRQILYFQDPVFSRRAKIPAPEQSDSLHPDSPAASPRSSQTTSVPKLNNSAQELNKEEIRARYFPA